MDIIDHKLYNINGFNILLINLKGNKSGNISVRSYIDTGYIHETENNLGINHLLEHILVNSNTFCNNNCITEMNKRGIIMNATTGLNIINYFVNGLETDLIDMLNFIINTTVDVDKISNIVIEKEKKAIIQELHTAYNDNLLDLLYISYKNLYNYYGLQNYYNYQKQINNLDHLNRETIIDFYKKNYNKILFVVSGNINNDKILNIFNYKLKNYKITGENNKMNCFSFNSNAYFIQDDDVKNTTIIINFPSLVKNTNKNIVLIDTITKYLNNICLDILRYKEELIYGVSISYTINYCGTNISIILNITNKYANVTLKKFMNIIKSMYDSIDMEFIKGIKKKNEFNFNKKNQDDYIKFYEDLYINKLFNKSEDKIITLKEYQDLYLNIDEKDIKTIAKELFNINTATIVYRSKVSII